MHRLTLLAAVACAGALLSLSPARAAVQETRNDDLDSRLRQLASTNALTLACDVPPAAFRPKLAALKRSFVPDATSLRQQFLGAADTQIGSGESIVSPIWGRGKRYKSGVVIYALPTDRPSVMDPSKLPRMESVPAFLDLYQNGFVYSNNVPKKAVRATEVADGGSKLKVNYRNEYSAADGAAAAEAVLTRMTGKLAAPTGFRMKATPLIQDFGERLFAYRVGLEHVTTYTIYKNVNGKATPNAEQKVAVPVLDCYAHVLLDGDKVLAGMEYFWDARLAVSGTPKECIQGADAVMHAQKWLLGRPAGHPLLTVTGLKLGYIQDRANATQLIPVWLFDAWYAAPGKGVSSIGIGDSPGDKVADPFAVHALTGAVIDL